MSLHSAHYVGAEGLEGKGDVWLPLLVRSLM